MIAATESTAALAKDREQRAQLWYIKNYPLATQHPDLRRVDTRIPPSSGCLARETPITTAISTILAKARVKAPLTLYRMSIPSAPAMDELSIPMAKMVTQARELKQVMGMPFWDCIQFLLDDSGFTPSATDIDWMIRQMWRHHALQEWPRFRLQVARHLESRLYRLVENSSELIGLSSRMGNLHLPMLDFRTPVSSLADATLPVIASRLLRRWVLVRSGQSYHLYGLRLVRWECLQRTLLLAQYCYPGIVDTRWITHQLLEEECVLRISRSVYPKVPQVVASTW